MELFSGGIGKRVLMNIQCDSVATCERIMDIYGVCFLTGVTAKSFTDLKDGIHLIETMKEKNIPVSAGLGDGSADQWERALQMALATDPEHLNQVFPTAALAQKVLADAGCRTIVNGLIHPTGVPGKVIISTGPLSEGRAKAVADGETAAAMLFEAGVKSIKFFPVEGERHLEEIRALARAAAKYDMIMEPTGGITPENVGKIVGSCLEAGVSYVMPHLYGSLKEKATGTLDMEKFKKAYDAIRSVVQ